MESYNQEKKKEWDRKIVKRMMLMRGFIGSMKHLTEQLANNNLREEEYINRVKLIIEEYEQRKEEVEE